MRLQLAIDAAPADDFLLEGQSLGQLRQTLSLGVTALPSMEVFAALAGSSSSSDRAEPSPTSLQAQRGQLGVKVFGAQLRPLHLGGQLSAQMQSDQGSQAPLLSATSIDLRAVAAFDLRDRAQGLPWVARLNLGYRFDNSARVIKATEDGRYALLDDARDRNDEDRHLVSRLERYAMGVNRVDRFEVGVGAELPLAIARDSYLHPLVEWRLGVPVNRQGYTCPLRTDDDGAATRQSGVDSCLGLEGFAAWPMNLSFGLRAVPPIRGVSLSLMLDLGLGGSDRFVHELAPNTPFTIGFTLGYDYDARPAKVVRVPAVVAEKKPAPGRVLGQVVDAESGAPIAGVTIALGARGPGLSSAADGSFISHELSPGAVDFSLSHADYESSSCSAEIASAGGDVELRCSLKALPVFGSLRGRVTDVFGEPIAGAQVVLKGAGELQVVSDGRGGFEFPELSPGSYWVRVDSGAHLSRASALEVAPRQGRELSVALLGRPAQPGVVIEEGRVVAAALRFEGSETQLGDEAALALAEVADLLLRQPPEGRVRIVGGGDGATSLARAQEIQRRLVEAGVPASSLDVAGEEAERVELSLVVAGQ